jgi:hypothetical protein
MTIRKDTVLYLKCDQQPQNGWLWATCHGRSGWIPSWAVDLAPPPPPATPPPPPPSQPVVVADSHRNRPRLSNVIHATANNTQPVDERQPHPEVSYGRYEVNDEAQPDNDEASNGFDLSNGVMGGQIPRPESERQYQSNNDVTFDSATKGKDSKRSGFLGKLLNSKVQPIQFYPKAKEPEWNPLPEIIYDGKVIQEHTVKKRGFFHQPKNKINQL